MVNEKLCRVCGYEMEEGPRDWNICPSCGTEFGLHDVNSSIENLRNVWLATGPRWYSTVVLPPAEWSPMQQLATLLFEEANIIAIYDLGTVMAATAEGWGQERFSYRLSELQYT